MELLEELLELSLDEDFDVLDDESLLLLLPDDDGEDDESEVVGGGNFLDLLRVSFL